MAAAALAPLQAELALWRAAQRSPRLWWRDDDLVDASPQLDCLYALVERHGAAVLMAAIPAQASAALADLGDRMPRLTLCQHGWQHVNHAAAGLPKSEFGAARGQAALEADLRQGAARLRALLGERFFPVFVPPWNAYPADAVALLRAAGLRGLSQYPGQPRPPAETGFNLVNAHLDILRWERSAVLQDPLLLAQRMADGLRQQRLAGAESEPFGLLTHHRAMGEEAWAFLDAVLALTVAGGARWLTPQEVFPCAV